MTLRVKANLGNVPLAVDHVTRAARMAGFDAKALYHIGLAVDEACANVVDHAYRGMEPGNMEVSCRFDAQIFTIHIRDWGRGFEPNRVLEPDVDAPLEKRPLGGLGLFLVKQAMDRVWFSFDPERGNELTMVKRLQVAE